MLFKKSSKYLALSLLTMLSGNAIAECEDLNTTKAIVDYVCSYHLVSGTQCRIW